MPEHVPEKEDISSMSSVVSQLLQYNVSSVVTLYHYIIVKLY